MDDVYGSRNGGYIPRRSRSPNKENNIDRAGMSPSPIQDDYFEGIETIRIERDNEQREYTDFNANKDYLIQQVVLRTRELLGSNLNPRPKSKKGKSKNPMINSLHKVSKYDLDRGYVQMGPIQ